MRIGKKVGFVLAAVILLTAGVCLRQPLQTFLVDWRVEKNLQSYREAMDGGDRDAAHRYALAAHQLKPGDLDCMLALLRIDGKAGRGATMEIAARVFRHPAAPLSEKARALEVFLDSGDSVVFRRLFDQLAEGDKRHPAMLRLYAGYLAQMGRIRDAAGIYEGLLKTATDAGEIADPELSLRLASALTQAAEGNPGVADRAQQLIGELLRLPDRVRALRALRLLQAIPPEQWQVDRLLDASTWVAEESTATVTDRLLRHSLEIRADESRREKILGGAADEFAASEPALVARWLGAMGEYERALDVVDIETARSSPEAYVARARMLHRAGRLTEASEWLADPHRGVRPSVVSTLRAVVAAAADSPRFWEKALQQAALEKDAEGFWRISAAAAASSNQGVEMRAAVEALKRPGAHPSVRELGPVIEWMYRNDRADDMRQVFRTLIRREPDSPMLRNNLGYLEIVSGRLSDPLIEQLDALCGEFPAVSEFATSRAVAFIAEGKYAAARDTLESAFSDWAKAPPPAVAAYAVVLGAAEEGASNRTGQFQAVRRQLQWNQMLSVEREFFQSRLQSAVTGTPDADQ